MAAYFLLTPVSFPPALPALITYRWFHLGSFFPMNTLETQLPHYPAALSLFLFFFPAN